MTAAEVLARLGAATAVTLEVRSDAGSGTGTGHANAHAEADGVRVEETGTWGLAEGAAMRWRAASAWRAEGAALRVEHVRQGTPAVAVLDRGPDGTWIGREPWVCGADRYAAELAVTDGAVVVTWTVWGPCKRACIVTRYA